MLEWHLWGYVAFPDFMALFGIAAVIAGGATLIVASMPTRGETLVQRIIFAVPRAAGRGAAEKCPRTPTVDSAAKAPFDFGRPF